MLTVAQLRAMIAGLPGDTPIAINVHEEDAPVGDDVYPVTDGEVIDAKTWLYRRDFLMLQFDGKKPINRDF